MSKEPAHVGRRPVFWRGLSCRPEVPRESVLVSDVFSSLLGMYLRNIARGTLSSVYYILVFVTKNHPSLHFQP